MLGLKPTRPEKETQQEDVDHEPSPTLVGARVARLAPVPPVPVVVVSRPHESSKKWHSSLTGTPPNLYGSRRRRHPRLHRTGSDEKTQRGAFLVEEDSAVLASQPRRTSPISPPQWCYDVCNKNNVTIDEMEADKDHLHLLVDIPPTLAPSKLVMLLKQQTTFHAWKKYEAYLKKHFWKEKTFWSDGYFVCSTGDASTQTIQEYIKNQG